jgi:flagellar biosynthesis/type III secretory pathway protein FliH
MYHRIKILLSPLLLATLALSAVVAPQALAAPPQAAAITAPRLFPQTQQGDFAQGFRDGFRKGHDDGETDGQLECRTRPFPLTPGTQTDYQRGFAEGYPQGYQLGFQRFCGGR